MRVLVSWSLIQKMRMVKMELSLRMRWDFCGNIEFTDMYNLKHCMLCPRVINIALNRDPTCIFSWMNVVC